VSTDSAPSRLPDLRERTLNHAFARALDRRPDALAHIGRDGQWTYAQAYDRSLRLAAGFDRAGVAPGDRVAALLDNSFDAMHVYLGLGLTGRVQVPINTAYKGTFLSHVINDCGSAVVVVEGRYCGRLAAIADEIPQVSTVVVRGESDEALPAGRFRVIPFGELLTGPVAAPLDAQPWDVQAYFYTSGTSGVSKGVRVPQAQAYTYASREDDPRAGDHERILVVLPIFHLAGQMFGIYQSLISAATCVLEPAFSVGTFWELVREHRITTTLLLGGMAQMVELRPESERDQEHPLELVHMAPLVADVAAFRARFGVEVGSVYGSTEAGCPVVGPPETIVGGECGYPRPGYRCRVVDEHDIEVATGEIGELVVRSDEPWTMFDGYVGLPEATEKAYRNLWFHTGDAFRADETGRLFFVDRVKDALRRRGENISSFEVERVINDHPSVLESAAVAVPAEYAEDEIKAVVVVREGADFDPADLMRFLIPRMPYFMVPKFVEVVPEMPRTPTQKVRKNVLRDSGIAGAWDREGAGIVVTRNS
jgi:crotonobetaine/carnitine-CoA ligase